MELSLKELKDRIENRLQLLLTISIFFPAILYSFFKATGEQDQISNSIFLKASTLIIAYILSYLAFVVFKNNISLKWQKFLNVLVLLGICSFVAPIGFATSGLATLSIPMEYLLIISIGLQTGMAIVIGLFIVFFGLIMQELKGFLSDIKDMLPKLIK